jgi:hypothetical protein
MRAHQIVTGGGGVAFVEDEVDDVPHRGESLGEPCAAWHLERQLGFAQRSLCSNDPLRDRRFGNEEGARDLRGRQPAKEAQRERDAALHREHRVASDEDQTEHVVAHLVVDLASGSGTDRVDL